MKPFRKILSFTLSILMLISGASLIAGAKDDFTVRNMSCTMYKNGATGRGFAWVTQSDCGSDVQIVKTSQYDKSFSNASTYSGTSSQYRGRYTHHVAVTNLKPRTQYTYRVGDKNKKVWGETGTFTTDDKNSKFSFITIADVQASNKNDFKKAYETVKSAYKKMSGAEFLVNLGDYVNDNNNEQWDLYFDTFKGINNKLTHVAVAGNHDGIMDGKITGDARLMTFKNTFCLDESKNQSLDGVYYSFDYGNAHFAVLNTNDMYPMSQAQRNWLRNDMSASSAQWKIIFCHRSIYSAGKNINKPDTLIMRQMLIPIIDELGIDVVYSGHDHMYLRTAPVRGDKKVETKYITEKYNDKKTEFALNPNGTIYALPSTAGTKRYTVNEDAISPILSVAEKAFSTRDMGGCFCTTQINGNKLIYKAYTVDDKTKKTALVDEFAIKKTTAPKKAEPTSFDDTLLTTLITSPINLAEAVTLTLTSYIKLLLQVIVKQF